MKYINFCTCVILIFANLTFAQDERKRANFWHFGNNAGLNFTCPPPESFAGSPLVSNEGSASMSDLNGNLLMFTNGETVWDRNNNIMSNGMGLWGHVSTLQSAIIVPHPGNPDRYFIFTAGPYEHNGTIGVRFSEVDMTLNGGLGAVLPGNKNTLLFAPNEEKLTAVRNAAGNGYWVAAQEKSSNRWYAYEVTAAGVNMTPVISVTGPTTMSTNSFVAALVSGAKFSPDGTMLVSRAVCDAGMATSLALYRFNNATGVIQYAWSDCGTYGYEMEFSPDCTKLYALAGWDIFQYDLSSGASITDSVSILASRTQIIASNTRKALRLANDCKIYVKEGFTSIGIIKNPNLAGTACNYVPNSFNLAGGSHGLNFPNFVQSFFSNNCDNLEFDLTAQDAGCNSDGAITLTINQGIAPFTFQWSNGETTQNISELIGGWYSVTVTNFDGCSLTDSIFVSQPPTVLIENEIITNPTSCGATDGSIDLTIGLVGGNSELIISETFETDGLGTRYTLVGEQNTPMRFFKRGQLADFTFSGGTFSGQEGTHYFGVRWATASPATLTLNPVTVTGYSNRKLCILVASFGNATAGDYYSIEYRIDGGAWTTLTSYRPTGSSPNRIAEDTNNDGIGDGIHLTSTFQDFCYSIPSAGNQIEVRVVTNTVSTQSQFAFDNIRLTGLPIQTYSVVWSNSETTEDINNLASGNYSVEITTSSGCVVTEDYTVVDGCTLLSSFIPSETTICEGETITFIDNSSGQNITSWNWTFTGGIPNSATTQGPNIITFNASGIYNIVLEIEDNLGNTDDTTIVVIVNTLPMVTANNDSPFCDGESITLTASGGTSYLWVGPNGYSETGSPVTISSASGSQAGVYTVTATDLNGCVNTATTTVVSSCGSYASFIPSQTAVCVGETITFTDNSGGGTIVSWNWIFDGGTPTSATTQGVHTISFLSPGIYNIVLEIEDNIGNIDDTTIVVTVNGLPTTSALNDGPLCLGADVELTASGGVSYLWTGPNGYSSNSNPAVNSNITINGFGVYTVTVTDANGCQNTDQTTVQMGSGPDLVISGTNVSCFGGSDGQAVVSVSGGTPGYSYNWIPVGGNGNSASNLPAGTYTVTVVDNAGCSGNLSVTLSQPSQMSVSEDVTHTTCGVDNGIITFSVVGGTGGYTYNWLPNISSVNTASNLAVGTYNVLISDVQGCSMSLSVDVEIGSSFFVDAYPETSVITPGGSVNLNVYVDPTITVDNLLWTPPIGLSCISCNNPTASPTETITYVVSVVGDHGCISTDTVTIIVIEPCGEPFVPTIFSPNGDGLNDLECILGDCVVSVDFTIYNRWGELVFHTEDKNNCWDGNFRGQPVQSGVYVYKLKATIETGELIEQSGNINVTR